MIKNEKVRVSSRFTSIFVLILSLVVVGCGEPKQQQQSESPSESTKDQQVNLNFASMSMGGSWYVYAVNIAELIKTYLPAGSTVDVFPYQGGVGNPILVNNGEADIALSFSAIGNWAYNGIVDYEEKGKMANIRALVGGLNKPHRVGILTTKIRYQFYSGYKGQKYESEITYSATWGSGETLARQVLKLMV